MAEGECKALSLIFRIAALGLSVAAVVVMGTAGQLVIVDGGSPGSSSYSVSYSQYNALRYFVAAGAIAAVCSAAALYLFAVCAGATVVSLPLVPLFDAATQGFLFSAAGAALAARNMVGSSSTGTAGPWGSTAGGAVSVCDVAGAFCGRVTVAAGVCAFAAVSAAVAALARDAGHGSSEGRRCEW